MFDQTEIHGLALSENVEERKRAVEKLKDNFSILPDDSKNQAWDDLHRLTQDKNDDVRRGAAFSLGTCYSDLPADSKNQAWDDLHRLTQDKNKDVRVVANHSSGRVSIYRASQEKDDESVRKRVRDSSGIF